MSAGKLGGAALAAPTQLVSSTARADTTERVSDQAKARTVLTGTGANARSAAQSLDFKTLLALAAAALPALAVAAILGSTLITAVSQAEHDFDKATSAARRLVDIRVLIEKESGLIARIPAEADLRKHSQYASEIADVGLRLDATIADLTPSEGIVSPEVAQEIRLTRAQMKATATRILNAAQSFAQAAALEQFNGPFEAEKNVLVALLDAVRSNVQGVINEARTDLRASSQRARHLTPIALSGALIAIAFGVWMIRRNFVRPLIAPDLARPAHPRQRGSRRSPRH